MGKHRHILYSPFSVAEAGGGRKLGTSWEGKKKYIVVRHGDGAAPLAGVEEWRVIYIVCHTSPGGSVAGDNNKNTLTALQMAERIKADGLPCLHQTMKLWSCSGGLAGPTDRESFGQKLLKALRGVGYDQLDLYAYTDKLWSLPEDYDPPLKKTNRSGVHKVAGPDEANLGRAKEKRILVEL
jgi:hypothetical protein